MSDKIITLKQKDTGDRLFPKTVKESIIDLEIDQEYNAESTNAQSGTAVAEAIEDAITELPDVNNGLLTIQKNGTNICIFSANSSTNLVANILVPTDTGDLTNNEGYTKNLGTVTSVNNIQPDAQGNVTIQTGGLPSQTGQSGKYLTTDGTNPSWSNVDALPSQSGHTGDVLTTDGTNASWNDTTEVYPVIETYSNGASWYRVYATDSTGYQWCEQGGKYTVASSSPHTMNLLKEMKDTSYNIILTAGIEGAGDTSVQINVKTDLITTTSFAIQKQWTSNNGYYFWEVKGYIEAE